MTPVWRRLRKLFARIAGSFRRRNFDAGFDEEIRTHLALLAERFAREGMSPDEAARAARRQFGGVTQLKNELWDRSRFGSFEALVQDSRYAIRQFRKSPLFAIAIVLTFALGIGANTAIFSVLQAVMLRSLPVRNPGQLVELLQKYPGEPRGNGYWTEASYLHFCKNNTVFSGIIGFSWDRLLHARTEHGVQRIITGEYVTANYFDVLGVQPALGRLIGPDDVRLASPVAVVSWAYWKSELNGDPNAVGERIHLQKELVTVIGVAPHTFVGPFPELPTDVWLPKTPSRQAGIGLMARLKPGVTIDQARTEMAVLYQFTIRERAARSSDPLVWKLKVEVALARNGLNFARDRIGKPLLVLMCTVGLLLLIMCLNIAALLLARGAAREREFAVRVGMGASRGRLVRQVLTESLLLSISGTLIGVMLAYRGTAALETLLASGRIAQQMSLRIHPDWHTLQFAIGTALLVGLLFGIAPAWNAVRQGAAPALREAGTSTGRSTRLFGKTLVAAQVALSMLLLSTGALFVANLWNLEHAYLGFERDHILVVTLDQAANGYTGLRIYHDYQEVLTRVTAMPGVRSASFCAPAPLSGAGAAGFVNVEGYQERPSDKRWIEISHAAPDYFRTMGIPVLRGRAFTSRDQSDGRTVIINETFNRRYFAGRDPIAKRITLYHVTLDPEPKSYEVIGVVADAHYSEIREQANGGVYLPAFHDGFMNANNLVIRTNDNPEHLIRDVRVLVEQVMGGRVPVRRITTLNAQIDASIVPERLIAMLSGFFAGLGALLVGIGIYALLAYSVARRTKEIGIRVALGATVGQVRRMVLGDTISVVLAGLVAGAPLAIAGRRLALRLMQDLTVQSVAPIVVGGVGLILIALVASYIPLRRASGAHPLQALRHE